MEHGTRKQVELSFEDLIDYKTIVRIGGSHGTDIKKEVTVKVIPNCKTCKYRKSKCATNNIVCDRYSLVYEKRKKLTKLNLFLKGYTKSFAINEVSKFFMVDKEQATIYYNNWRKYYMRCKEW